MASTSLASSTADSLALRVPEVAVTLLGNPTSKSRDEWRWGRKGSLAVNVRTGIWYDHEGGRGGDVLDLVAHALQTDIRGALAWARDEGWHASGEPVDSPPVRRRDASEDVRNLERAAEIVPRRKALMGTGSLRYLERRAGGPIPINLDHALGHSTDLQYSRSVMVPGIVGIFTDIVTNQPTGGIHRIPVDGNGNRPIDRKKLSLGPTAGAVIRLWPDESVEQGVFIGEGIETCLAAAVRHGLAPIWATIGTATMAKFPVLPGVDSLTVIADHDPKGGGELAARAAVRRWQEAGREARILIRTERGDFADRECGHA